MKVRATQLGYYEHERRYPGDVFELKALKRMRKDKDGNMREVTIRPEQQFSERWMEKVNPETPKIRKTQPYKNHISPASLKQAQQEAPHQEAQEEASEQI